MTQNRRPRPTMTFTNSNVSRDKARKQKNSGAVLTLPNRVLYQAEPRPDTGRYCTPAPDPIADIAIEARREFNLDYGMTLVSGGASRIHKIVMWDPAAQQPLIDSTVLGVR